MKKTLLILLAFLNIVYIHSQNDSVFVSVAPSKINVFYVGIDNPIAIGVTNLCGQHIEAKIDKGTIKYKGNGEYTVRVDSVGNANVSVFYNKDGKTYNCGNKQFRVKKIPSPIITVGNRTGGKVNKNWLYIQFGIKAVYEGLLYDLPINVTSFSISTDKKPSPVFSNSKKFTAEQLEIIRTAKFGDEIYFKNIKALRSDGITMDLPDMVFNIQYH